MATTGTLEENKRIARRFPEEVATEGNVDLIDEICTEDVVDRSPLGEVRGRDALRQQLRALNEAFTDHTATVDEIIAEGDLVAMRVTLSGTHDGSVMGLDPTGRPFEAGNMVFTRIEGGKIAERWVIPDMLGMFRQLGIEELPPAPDS